jgi:5-methylcytosine-specific restriction enzyme A
VCGQAHNRTRRPAWLSAFYSSGRWQKVRAMKLSRDPLCERCLPLTRLTVATEVHHRIAVLAQPDLGLALENLESLCAACHNAIDKTRTRRDG